MLALLLGATLLSWHIPWLKKKQVYVSLD